MPEEAGIGATPLRAANDASLFTRSGLSPKVTNSCEATAAPTSLISKISGALAFQQELVHAIFPINILHGQLEAIPEELRGFVTPESIFQALGSFPGHRKARGIRHQLGWILAATLCAVLSGAKSVAAIADWATYAASTSLPTTGFTAPHVTTFQRVLARLDAEGFDRAFGAWMQTQVTAQVIAIDGKEIRGAKNGDGDRVHFMSALDRETGAVIVQVDVGVQTDEITRLDSLLETLGDLEGKILTIDALHTLGRHTKFLNAQGARFVTTVPGNQSNLLKQLTNLPWGQVPQGN